MRLIKTSLILAITLLTASFAFPELAWSQEESAPQAMAINMGDWQIAGEGEFFRTSDSKIHTLTLSPQLEYFIVNRFSAGATFLLSDSNITATSYSVGPSLTWYFAILNRTAFKFKQSVLYVNPPGEGDNYVAGQSGLGIDYFLTPNVSIGPSLQGLYYISSDTNRPQDGLSIRASITVLL